MNKRKKKIAEHSLALFLEKGIRNTSIQDIIERAGISKGTFYNYFSSKNECIGAILEEIRYEASLRRSELLFGKDPKDVNVLIEQLAILGQLNEKRGMSAVFEEMLHSGDGELKKLVLNYRISELEWLADRLIDVFGEELRPYAVESSVIFFGMLHHLLFVRKLMNQHTLHMKTAAASVFHYMEHITQALIHRQTAVLDPEHIVNMRQSLRHLPIDRTDIIHLLKELLEDAQAKKPQVELAKALMEELERDEPRKAVIQALLQPFADAYEDAANRHTAREIASLSWYYMKQTR